MVVVHSKCLPPLIAMLPAPQHLTLITWQTGMEICSVHFSLLAQICLQHTILKLSGGISFPVWGCVLQDVLSCWGLMMFCMGDGTKQHYVLLQMEKADRRQNFVSLALRKRYSYLTEPGMSELLLPNTKPYICDFSEEETFFL